MAEEGRPEKFYHSVPVPMNKLDWVVGNNGEYLKQIEEKSDAVITISDSVSTEYGRAWKYLSIYGSGRSVDIAKKLLFVRIDKHRPVAEEEEVLKREEKEDDKKDSNDNEVDGTQIKFGVT
mmetsp:Transcript_98872/g.279353  ORF Transcript_98872/g.279353 Transcript_98872/m.279353 type:complete len:121 (+) Transcript_98872:86-448(+)